ncbi:hypothetical protein [Chlorogloeopsis sp. ULAP02]|uniref:hypothetical protein n=1 Tax=Chlorogloeopsis sp. ULAP02 TaxID=3107926 RepID=UPI003136630A
MEIEPQLLESFFLEDGQYSSDVQKLLFKGEDWKLSFYPTVTPAMRSLAQQMWNPPYHGAATRMYLQAKVFELVQLEHPPSLCELAQQVGVSVRNLQRGFPILFNTIVFNQSFRMFEYYCSFIL